MHNFNIHSLYGERPKDQVRCNKNQVLFVVVWELVYGAVIGEQMATGFVYKPLYIDRVWLKLPPFFYQTAQRDGRPKKLIKS